MLADPFLPATPFALVSAHGNLDSPDGIELHRTVILCPKRVQFRRSGPHDAARDLGEPRLMPSGQKASLAAASSVDIADPRTVPECYAETIKAEKPLPRLEDVELVPDAAERLERAGKHAFRQQPAGSGKPRRVAPIKPKKPR